MGAHFKRVEIGDQMAADPVGADDHQRADAVQHRLLDLIVADRDARLGGFRLDLLGLFRGLRPLAVQRGRHLIIRNRRPVGACPAWPLCLSLGVGLGRAKLAEEALPGFIDRIGIAGIAGLKLLDIFGVMALQERGCTEDVVGGLFGHGGLAGWCRWRRECLQKLMPDRASSSCALRPGLDQKAGRGGELKAVRRQRGSVDQGQHYSSVESA